MDDAELKQLFHDIDLRFYGATSEQDQRQAEVLKLYSMNKQAENMVTQAERDQDGNVLLSGVPVRAEDALYFARLDVHHFEQTDLHLKPEQLVTRNHSAYDSGTRPNNENPSAYLMIERANYSLGKLGQTEHERKLLWAKSEAERKSAEALRQKMRNLYSYNELKVHYGMDPEVAAWQLGFKKTLNEFLYGLHNFLEGVQESPHIPNYKNPLPYNTYDLSLEAHFPNRTQIGSIAANSIINKQVKNLLPAYKNKPFVEKWIKEQIRGQIVTDGTKAIKARSNRKKE